MTTYPMHYTDNANSWRRLLMLARFYQPELIRVFAVCAVCPFLLYALASFVGRYSGALSVSVVLWPIGLLMYVAPVMLAWRDYRSVSSQLPVTAAEKTGFLILVFWILVPLVVYLCSALGNIAWAWIGPVSVNELLEEYKQAKLGDVPVGFLVSESVEWWISVVTFVSTSSIIMYYVVVSRGNRVLAGLLSYFVVTLASAVFSVAVGIVVGLISAEKGSDTDNLISEITAWVTCLLVVAIAVAGVIYFVKLYRRLRNCGF